jgi:hypothetical protein
MSLRNGDCALTSAGALSQNGDCALSSAGALSQNTSQRLGQVIIKYGVTTVTFGRKKTTMEQAGTLCLSTVD